MAKECGDCFYCHLGRGDWYCDKKGKYVSCLDPACAQFVSDEKKSCGECMYAEYDGRWFAGNDSYMCTKRNKKVKGSDVQCSSFVPD